MPNPDNEPQLPKNQSPIIDDRTGLVSRDWYRFFLNLLNKANTGGGGSGTVTSVNVSGGTTGLTTSGGPVTTSGTITLAGTLNVANGGTGATTAAGARTNLSVPSTTGSGASGTWGIDITGNATTVTNGVYTTGSYADPTWITSIAASKLTGTVATTNGGTGLSSIGTANQLLGVNNGASGLEYKSLVAGSNITITQGVGTVTINSSNPGGTVTSVGLSLPAQFTVTGSPVTSSGTLTGAWANQTANLVFASPNGSTGVPSFRSLVSADIPALSYVSSVSGTSPVVSSGGLTPAISLASGYGDTQNPYASKTANFVLAAPNGVAGVPTFRAVVAADIPTLNQNTTGSAATLTTGRTISITGDLAYTSPSFDGSANVTAAGTLATVNANVGSFTNASITVNGKGLITAASSGTAPVTSVTGTSPVVSSGGATPAISLASGYGDTQNPYASKTANFFLAAPNGSAGVPTFRAIVAADVPTLNQNTTGTASNVTGVVAIANGGTGQTTASAAFNALSPVTSTGDLIIGNGTNSSTRLPIGANNYVLTSNGTTAVWAVASGSGATITNDTSTSTNVYPTFAAATSGALSTIYTSNAKLLYKPSTGELTSTAVVASNGIFVNNLTINTSYTIATGTSGMSAGPITVASGVTVTVASGSRWVVA